MEPGAIVKHATFGVGVILSADETYIRISFSGDCRLFSAPIVKLTPYNGPVPKIVEAEVTRAINPKKKVHVGTVRRKAALANAGHPCVNGCGKLSIIYSEYSDGRFCSKWCARANATKHRKRHAS